MGQTFILRTVEDFERAYGHPYGKLLYEGLLGDLQKQLLTTTAGVYASHYGAKVWAQLNLEANLFAALRKEPWGPEDGWRVLKGYPSTKVSGVAENGNIPAGSEPDYDMLTDKPKSEATVFDASEIEILTAKRGQAITWESLRDFMGQTHKVGINEVLLENVTTLPVNNFESLDRVISSYSEVTNCADVDAGDSDIYDIDRDAAASWADATVLHNSDADRDLDLSLIDTLFRTVMSLSGKDTTTDLFWLTGWDTWQRWGELLQPQQRFEEVVLTASGFGGIRTPSGREAGFTLSTYLGIPILVSQAVQVDGISRIYLVDNEYVHMSIDRPTVYSEAGTTNGTELLLGNLGAEGMYRTIGELKAEGFFAHGKIRDLQ